MSATGTYRGTPKARGQVPFANSPSNIPRPTLDTNASDAGTSTLSASRQKQSKRDEVRNYPTDFKLN